MKPIVLLISKTPDLIAKNISLLESNGFNTIIASDINRAKKRISLYPPHCLIVFYHESVDIVKDVRASVLFKDLPIIVIARDEDYFIAKDISNDLDVEVYNNNDSNTKVVDKLNLLISKYRLKEKKIKINKKIRVRSKTKITEINETQFSFNSNIEFNGISVCPIRSRFFVKLGFNPVFALLKEENNISIGSFVGLKEDERTNIRKWINHELTRQD